ncbi:ribbon-helix-helix protein, CopG family [Acinetobacter baumannii]|uniref:ribbon-helix-helix protein, CopG family n=1 Tax=Acinetobacter baumannii TaxID=470 RepID=UPI003F609101
MSEKLTASVTFKCTEEMKIKLERIARSRKLNGSSELMRIAAMDIIFEVEEMLNCLQMPIDLTTVTEDTKNTPEPFELELAPNPHKTQAQKRPNCRNQLSLICHSTAKQ